MVLLAAMLIGACAASDRSMSGDARTVRGVTVTFRVDPARSRAGQPVRLRLTLFNNAGVAEQLRFASAKRYDFAATKDGREVWRWSDGRAFTQVITDETIAGQGSLQFVEVWRPDANGTYEVRAVVLASGYEGEMAATLEVT